jgi:cytoskeleton protein RodZ
VSYPTSPGQDSGAQGSESPRTLALKDLGLLLRQAREAQGIEPEALADRLRIGVEQLQALETAEIGRLPEAVFVIAQARRVAAALKLDVEPQLTALRAIGNGAPAARPRPPVRTASAGDNRPRRGLWRGGLLPWLSLLLAAAAGLWGVQRLLQDRQRLAPRPAAPMTATPTAARPGATTGSAVAAAPVLVLEGAQPSWVQVRRPDGTTLFKGLLEGTHSFPLDQGLEVLAGRPDLVRAGPGSSSLRPLGAISDVRWRRFVPQR